MPRSFLVKNKRSTSYNLHRPYEDETKSAVITGENQNFEQNLKKKKKKILRLHECHKLSLTWLDLTLVIKNESSNSRTQ